jgi:hypothetical protein
MQRSSSSIGGLAAALANAQAELVNPEKSLVGSIYPDGPAGVERIFRYAPLSAGLDIVRKTLGQHDIAVVQSTAVDHAAGMVNLTTVLAHASGEWIASDWPVCAISETTTPHRMGAALTYARRYSLFTLVGIAGEDDLDAPDLITPTSSRPDPEKPKGESISRPNGSRPAPRGAFVRRNDAKTDGTKPILGPQASGELRDRLLAELNALASADDAAHWAHRHLRAKNDLTASDAKQVEMAFQTKLTTFGDDAQEEVSATPPEALKPTNGSRSAELPKQLGSRGIDKSVLAVPEPRRIRDRDHVRSVAKQPCLVCGRRPSDAHHLRFAQARALGRKASDEFTVPLCRGHHREVHRCGDEAEWWRNAGIDPMVVARALWVGGHSTEVGALPSDAPS